MRKIKFLIFAVFVTIMILVGSINIPVLAWFDRQYDGYLLGAPSNGRLGYTHGTDVRAWTLEMRWNTTYYIKRDNNPRIDITADCDSGTGADHLHVINFSSNLPGATYQSWSDCGNILIKEEGEIFFDKNGISTTRTDYEADVIFQKKNQRTGNGAINHTYQRSSGLDSKVCGSICGDPNHDWLAKSIFDANYNFIQFDPQNAGWTAWLGVSKAYSSALPDLKRQSTFTLSPLGAPFTIRVAKDGEHTRAYIETDFTNLANLNAYMRWNIDKVQTLSTNLEHHVRVKLTFRFPISIADAQKLIDATGLKLEQVTFVGQSPEGQPYSGATLSDGVDSTIRLGALRSIWEEKKIQFHGVMVIEGILSRRDAFQILLKAPQIYLVDVTAYLALQELNASGITDLQGIVVPSPYWWLYLDWLSG